MTDSVAASLAASTIEDGAASTIEDGAVVVPGDDDGAAAAAKKAAANKKKRERQKAKKKADGEERDGTSFLRDVVPDLGATVLKEERRDAGPNRGQGMFATAAAEQKAVLAEAVPALTVVFDGATSEVRPAFMSSETFMKLHVQYHKAGIARFPNVAMLQCCAINKLYNDVVNKQFPLRDNHNIYLELLL